MNKVVKTIISVTSLTATFMGESLLARLSGIEAGYQAAQQTTDTVITLPLWGYAPMLLWGLFLLLMVLLWKPKRKTFPATACLLALISFVGCAPPKVDHLAEIKNNETAFLVPLEGNNLSAQTQFMSVDFLEKAKIPAKRIVIPVRERSIGRMPWEIEWIPTMRVITVDRTPVTREWVDDSARGTSSKSEGIKVESLESVGFSVGINITAMIREEDAARFLYYYPASSLAQVMDHNVRGFVQSILSREFGSLKLADCQSRKKEVTGICLRETREHFAKLGITIDNLGIAEGLTYQNPAVQQAIDASIMAESRIRQAENERQAQEKINQKEFSIAQNERAKAEEFKKAADAQVSMIRLKIEEMNAQARLESAKRWNGQVPSHVVPASSPFLFGMGDPK